ncbi:MAG: DUF948 domain-containing protein [Gorillibacterium sp.]|nr:DUF948 domain-containing protein [Gorillibacterium sp.]
MIWEISVAVVALAFVILVFFLVRTLTVVQQSLQEMNYTINNLQEELNDVSSEVKGLIRNTNQITLDLRTKMKSLDSLFGTAENVGDTLEVVTSSIRNISNRFLTNQNTNIVEQAEDKGVYKVIKAVTSMYNIWQKVKANRNHKKREASG